MEEFVCDDGSCIPGHYRCDGTFADCDGSEDEQNCGKCTPRMVGVSRVSRDVTEPLLTVTVPRMSKTVVSTLLGWKLNPGSL